MTYANGVVHSTVGNQLFVLSSPDANSLAYSANLPADTISLDVVVASHPVISCRRSGERVADDPRLVQAILVSMPQVPC